MGWRGRLFDHLLLGDLFLIALLRLLLSTPREKHLEAFLGSFPIVPGGQEHPAPAPAPSPCRPLSPPASWFTLSY